MSKDLIFYQKTFSTDNYLLTGNGGLRKQVAYNQAKVKSCLLSAGTLSEIMFDNLPYKHYKVKITFTDDTFVEFTAYSLKKTNAFGLTPVSQNNLLRDLHSANYVKWEEGLVKTTSFNEFRDQNQNIVKTNIFYNNVLKGTLDKSGDKRGNTFTLNHVMI